jgi:hypothetical protein
MSEGSTEDQLHRPAPGALEHLITAGFIKQAYTIMRLPLTLQKRKELFLELAAKMADAIEAATQRG